MKNVFVPTENYQQLKAECQGCMENAHGVEMVAVVGDAGRGKSTAAERIAVENTDVRFVRLTPGRSPAGFLIEVTAALTGDLLRSCAGAKRTQDRDITQAVKYWQDYQMRS